MRQWPRTTSPCSSLGISPLSQASDLSPSLKCPPTVLFTGTCPGPAPAGLLQEGRISALSLKPASCSGAGRGQASVSQTSGFQAQLPSSPAGALEHVASLSQPWSPSPPHKHHEDHAHSILCLECGLQQARSVLGIISPGLTIYHSESLRMVIFVVTI